MPSSGVTAATTASCSYCCADVPVEDAEEAACRYCGNPPSPYSLVLRDAVSEWTARLIQRPEPEEDRRGHRSLIEAA